MKTLIGAIVIIIFMVVFHRVIEVFAYFVLGLIALGVFIGIILGIIQELKN